MENGGILIQVLSISGASVILSLVSGVWIAYCRKEKIKKNGRRRRELIHKLNKLFLSTLPAFIFVFFFVYQPQLNQYYLDSNNGVQINNRLENNIPIITWDIIATVFIMSISVGIESYIIMADHYANEPKEKKDNGKKNKNKRSEKSVSNKRK